MHVRRRRYPGKNPRDFHDKYKELNPARYPADVEKVLASGRTPAGTHLPIMVEEVLHCMRPKPGEANGWIAKIGGFFAHYLSLNRATLVGIVLSPSCTESPNDFCEDPEVLEIVAGALVNYQKCR